MADGSDFVGRKGLQIWATFVDDAEGVGDAIELCRSFLDTKTMMKKVVFVGPKVSLSLRDELDEEFDCVLPSDPQNWEDVETYSKISLWNFTLFDKIVFLDNKLRLARNCDEIFNTELGVFGSSFTVGGELNALFVKPCRRFFLKLMASMKSHENKENLKELLDACLWNENDFGKSSFEAMFGWDINSSPIVEKHVPKILNTPSPSPDHEPIAIVGMSCRLPSANNVEEFWKLLMEQRSAMGNIPEDRWTPDQSCNITADNKSVLAGFLKFPVHTFDGKFFGCSPAEVSNMDPQHRLLLEITWEALEDAGIDPTTLHNTDAGVFTGLWLNDYKHLIIESGGEGLFRSYMGNALGTSASRIAHFLGVKGPNLGTESGCSSSIVAIGMGVKALRAGETNLAIVGGVNLILKPFRYEDFQGLLSPTGHCHVFDKAADGFARAEGCGVLIMKKLSDALKDGDEIKALIRGYGAAQEGPSKSMGTPTIDVEAQAMKLALKDAGNMDPSQVQFVEAHGTGTSLGDPLEVSAISKVYSTPQGNIARNGPLVIGSVKANIGHTESASGITGVIKTVLALKHEMIPPHYGLKELNPKINLEEIPAIIPLSPLEWKRTEGRPRLAGVSSFGITGTDGHLIIQEAPVQNSSKKSSSSKPPSNSNLWNILTISAKSPEALEEQLKKYQQYLENNATNGNLDSICYSANTGRAHLGHRVTVTAGNVSGLVQKLKSGGEERSILPGGPAPKLCFLFSGQGSQYAGMGKRLYEVSPVFRRCIDIIDTALNSTYRISVKDIIWGENAEESVNSGVFSQLAIFSIEFAMFRLWVSWGVRPDMILGHSFGEFAAAYAAGVLTLPDTLRLLVGGRGPLMESVPPGKMVVLKANAALTKELIGKYLGNRTDTWLDIAVTNSSEQTVVSGPPDAVDGLVELCMNNQVKTHKLKVSVPYHSRGLDSIMGDYAKTTSEIIYNNPICEYVSACDGQLVNGKLDEEYWVRHTRGQVRFHEASLVAYEEGSRLFLEVGPKPLLCALLQKNVEEVPNHEKITCIPSMRQSSMGDEWKTLLDAVSKMYLAGVNINWRKFYKTYNACERIPLPFYSFQRKPYWFEVDKNKSRRCGGQQLHALLGSELEGPNEEKTFQNFLSLNQSSFVRDHCVGDFVVFPGAGYLEMSLAAGSTLTHSQSPGDKLVDIVKEGPLSLENLLIKAPLALGESGSVEMQTVVKRMDESTFNISTHSRKEGKWINHTSVSMKPFEHLALVGVDNTAQSESQHFDLQQLKMDLHNSGEGTESLYEELAALGYNFGPIFKSIKKFVRAGDGSEIFVQINVPEGNPEYFVHPVVIDAMIQSFIFAFDEKVNALHLPISVGKFTWFRKESLGQDLYVHVVKNNASLYCPNGSLLAVMSGVEFAKTTKESIESLLQGDSKPMTWLFDEVWKPTGSKITVSMGFPNDGFLNQNQHKSYITGNSDPNFQIKADMFDIYNKISSLAFIRNLMDNGFKKFSLGDRISVQEIMDLYDVKLHHKRLMIFRVLEMLQEDGFLSKVDEKEMVFKVIQEPPKHERLSEIITQQQNHLLSKGTQINVSTSIDNDLVKQYGSNFIELLTGKMNVMALLFPEDANHSNASAESIYNSTFISQTHLELISRSFEYIVEKRLKSKEDMDSGRVFKILEVGGGTGTASRNILSILEKHNVPFQYTFTDISTGFFEKAKQTLNKYIDCIQFRGLNIENDITSQGFLHHSYDIVIALNVLHATKDLTESTRNVRHLLAKNGLFCNAENLAPVRQVDAVFGHLEGYWRFTDHHLRTTHCTVGPQKWEQVAKDVGFKNCISANSVHNLGIVIAEASDEDVAYIPPGGAEPTWLLFTDNSSLSQGILNKLKQQGRSACVINPPKKSDDFTKFESNLKSIICELQKSSIGLEGVLYLCARPNDPTPDPRQLTQNFLSLLQILISQNFKKTPKLFVITEGYSAAVTGDENPKLPHSSVVPGIARAFRSENSGFFCQTLDLDPDDEFQVQLEQIDRELWTAETCDPLISYRKKIRYSALIRAFKNTTLIYEPLQFPKYTDRFQLILSPTNAIADLSFGPLKKSILKGNEIEVQVKAAGLNFKDIFNVLKPTPEFKDSNSVGADFSGVVVAVGEESNWKVGDCVLGSNWSPEPLPNHVRLDGGSVVSLPPEMTFAEGATITTAFFTAYLCLVMEGKLKHGETILIHTASGGVGLCAVELAHGLGAKVIATAGSRRKRAYLRNLGVQHVFNSRDLTFADEIYKVTNGRGVDVVLNSLTGPGFKEASLRSCAKNARFLEMSKLNIWTVEDVRSMRPDVKYSVEYLLNLDETKAKRIMIALDEHLMAKKVNPLRHFVFQAAHIRSALSYLEKAKHIGKVIIEMPQISSLDGQRVLKFEMFNDRSSYLVTGGLGGIGLEVAKYISSNGGKYIIICGRSKPQEKTTEVLDSLTKAGKVILVKQLDIGDYQSCKDLMDELKTLKLPPLRGIMHAAGVLSDAVIPNQTMEKFETTYRPKIDGAWNLHQLTLEMNLEHFVLFSSGTATLGNHGQSNHSAANTFLDALATYRAAQGLPALSVNWGQWGEVGVAANIAIPCFKKFTTAAGINSMEHLMQSHVSRAGALDGDFSAWPILFPWAKGLLEELAKRGENSGKIVEKVSISSEAFWKELKGEEDRYEVVLRHLGRILGHILKLGDEKLDKNQSFQDVGLDSLMFIELKNSLQVLLGPEIILNASVIQDCLNLHMLTEKLLEIIDSPHEEQDNNNTNP